MAFRFYTLLANELKLKVKTFCGLIPRFAEVTGEKLSRVKSEYSFIKAWFADQNSKPLEIEDKINITLVIK